MQLSRKRLEELESFFVFVYRGDGDARLLADLKNLVAMALSALKPEAREKEYIDAREFSASTGLCLNADCLRCSPVMYGGKRETGNFRCGQTRPDPPADARPVERSIVGWMLNGHFYRVQQRDDAGFGDLYPGQTPVYERREKQEPANRFGLYMRTDYARPDGPGYDSKDERHSDRRQAEARAGERELVDELESAMRSSSHTWNGICTLIQRAIAALQDNQRGDLPCCGKWATCRRPCTPRGVKEGHSAGFGEARAAAVEPLRMCCTAIEMVIRSRPESKDGNPPLNASLKAVIDSGRDALQKLQPAKG